MNIDKILYNQPLDAKYTGRGEIIAYLHAVKRSVIAYCIKHGKKIPSKRSIGQLANRASSYYKHSFYTRYEINRIKHEIKEHELEVKQIENKIKHFKG